MVPYLPRQTEDHKPRRPFRSRIDAKTRSRRVLRLSLERLEPRHLLAGGFGDSSVVDDPPNAAQISWFESYDSVPRIAFEALGDVDQVYSSDFVGPRELARGEWIVQLTESTSRRIRDLSTSDEILDDGVSDFTIISGLGASGLVLVSGESTTAADIQSSLRRNSAVASFSLNSIVRGQQTPNDPEYLAGLLPGLEGIAAPTAWDRSIGNSSVVVGVVDGGIDATHPDLFLNIWLNQGEIPRTLRDQLADIDGDNLITFYDLNNLARSTEEIIVASTGAAATTAEMTTSTPFATGLNAGLVADKNGNGRIDAIDLLEDVRWADGRDGDGNSFFDDLFGVNFRSGSGDPFPSNRPLDELGHGTHVAGTIGAVGDNGFGVTGINWQTSLMSLRILDNNNQSDAAAAIRAINYARWMRDSVSFDEQGRLESGADLRVLNNSWGQPGGFEQAFSSVITELGDAGILFVAASGNGNLLGNGVNNDSTPFFPASYEADNLISVAALDASGGKLAGFSNYGPHSVDIAAPGTGVRSTLPGGGFGPANGTSMAAPHISGAAALIWSMMPAATVDEVKRAILENVDPITGGTVTLVSGGRLDVAAGINANVFAPYATLVAKQNISTTGGDTNEFSIQYHDRFGVEPNSLGDDDLVVTRQWGPDDPITARLKPGSIIPTSDGVVATYVIDAPGGGTFNNSVMVPIDAAAANTITSQILVSDVSQQVADFTVSLDIEHADLSDLTATLIAPDGRRSVLFSAGDIVGTGLSGTIFDDRSVTPITASSSPYSGRFQPAASILALGDEGPNGVWTLEIEDSQQLDGGSLTGWSLDFIGTWDAVDYGRYEISTVAGSVVSTTGDRSVHQRSVGSFQVRIEDDPAVLYVDSFSDRPGTGSLREAINAANAAAPEPRTIILESGVYTLSIPSVADPLSPFQGSDISLICGPSIQQTGWSNETAGDLDVLGSVTIIGSRNDETIIDAVGIDRVVKVHPGGRLNLDRVTITGGRSPIGQGGGGILSAGELTLSDTIIQENIAIGASATDPLRGGGVAVWNGTARLYRSWITENESDFGGGVFFCEPSSGSISHSTLSHNHGGGLHSHSDSMITLSNSTLSANSGGLGAIFHGKRDSVEVGPGSIQTYSISDDGRYVLFRSNIENLVPGDTNGEWDYFLRDRSLGTIRRVSFGSDWTPEFRASLGAKISTDGFFAFVSDASNLVPNDTNDTDDVFLLNWDNQSVERISLAPDGTEVTGGLWRDVSVSADGRYVAFASNSDNLVLGDTNRNSDVFVYDRRSRSIERISVDSNGNGGNGDSYVGSSALSDDGRYLVYSSSASNLVAGDTNNQDDVFIYDQVSRTTQRVPSNEFQQLFINGPSISADGQLVAFYNTHHVFVFDRPTQSIKRLSSAPDGSPSNRDSWKSSLSRDGRFVTFESYSSDLIAGDLDDSFELGSVEPDIFLYDLTNDSIQRLSVLPDGSPLDGGAYDPVLNRDASMAAFTVFHGGANNLYLFDQTSSEYLVVIDSAGTTLEASQVTIVDTNAAPYSVSGQVHLSNSMLSNAGLGMDPQVTRDNVVGVTPFIQPLVSIAGAPPVHPLTQGNVGIDSGSERFVGGVDQLGSPRKDPDIGAYESLTGKLSGHVFADTNADQVIAADEIGVPAITVIARNGDGRVFTAVSRTDDPNTATANESGLIDFDQLPIGNYEIEVVPPPFWKVSQPTVTYIRSDEDFFSVLDRPDISGDGQFIGVTSALADLVPGDGNDDFDVFLLDRASDHFERVSHGGDGTEGNGPSSGISISPDGRFVAFNSRASNLVGDDTNGSTDVFVVDRTSQTIERISVDNNGVEGNLSSAKPQISADGRYVAFHSIASNLVPNDDNNEVDVFVFDRQLKTVRRLSVDAAGEDKNYPSTVNSISTDGTLISFSSQAILVTPGAAEAVFVADHQNGTIEQISLKSDGTPFSRAKDSEISGDGRFVAFRGQMDGGDNDEIYLHDRVADTMYLVSRAFDGGVADGNSFLPSVNEDGRYVAFDSTSSNLVSGDTNGLQDLFVHDVISGETARVSVGFDGSEANGRSSNAKISDDGRWIAFWSYASNLVEGDVNELGDYFVVANPLLSAQTSRTVLAGGVDSTLDLGLIPDPGQIYGVLFEDLVANGALDTNEPRMEGWTVFLDDNRNGMVDTNETVTTTDAEGAYVLSAIPSFREYSVAVAPPTGWQQVSPIGPSGSAYKIFLPAGGDIGGRDFGFRKIVGTGQSTSSSVSGRITDAQGAPLEDIVVYLDSQNFGVRDPNEPATQTDQFGDYYLDSLGSSIVAVSTELGQDRMQISPLGSDFQLATTPLFDEVQPFANPQAIAVADFNSDGAPDIALALAEANKISIRLNNGNGGFLPDQIDIDLGQTGSGPTSLVVGQFNGPGTGLDIAATSNLASNVVLLYDFVGTGFNFQTYIAVGQQPTDIASVAIQGDSNYQDLVVTNSADNTVQVLANQSGFFSAKSPVSTGGVTPVALVAGRFGGGTHFDVAVVHASPSGNGPFGDVRILFGDAQSNLALSPSIYTVGAFPTDMVAANLDGDPNDTLDLAIPNFGSNSISILTGNGDGTFTSQTQTLGTARGAMDIVVADIENDGDPDILTGNLLDRNISIFRNKTTTPHATSFEPLEAIGLGQFSVAQRMPLAVANFDQDHSAPGGMGTVDIITIPSQSDTLHVLTNNLIDGSHRVQLTGLNQVVGLDFVVQPMILPPSLAPIPNPLPILEDDSERTIELVGIAKGRPGGPDLVFEVVSSDPNLIPHPTVGHVSGTSTANLVFTPVQHANGTAMITVTVTDAGANQTFGDSDDGTVVQAFSVIVNPVNDPPTFVIPSLISASQKAGPQSIDTFAANLSPGGGSDEATQVLTDFTVLAENGLLFSSPPAIDRQGRLTFTPDPNKSGITIVQVSLSDDGGRNFGGIDTTTKLFAINVLPVNDPPTINLRGDVTVSAGAGPYLDTGFATGFDPGSGDDDASQVISDFIVSVDRPDLFAIIPDISNDGTLRFTPLASATGKVTVTVQVRDDGGRSNGGNDLSSEQEFTITFATSPEVESVTINDGSSASRSLVTSLGIVFTGEVDHTTLAEAFTLTNIDSGNQVGVIAVVASDSGGKTSALLTFSGTSTVPRVGGNSLTDGNYRLNIVASRITTPGGAQAMTSDFQFGGQTADDSNNDDFFRLFGDTDGDGDVDGQDFGRFGLTFLKLQGDANHNPDLDSDGDGDVDGQDYGRFEQNFLRHL